MIRGVRRRATVVFGCFLGDECSWTHRQVIPEGSDARRLRETLPEADLGRLEAALEAHVRFHGLEPADLFRWAALSRDLGARDG